MSKILLTAVCLAALLLTLPQAQPQAQAAALNPRCVANYCPTCPQPLGASRHDKNCRRCLKKNLKRIMNCSRSAGSSSLSPAIIGLWQSNSGISMLVVQTTQGFKGHLHKVNKNMRKYYPNDNMIIMKARSSSDQNRYGGEFLMPQGKWGSAKFVVKGNSMVSHHGGRENYWRKQGR